MGAHKGAMGNMDGLLRRKAIGISFTFHMTYAYDFKVCDCEQTLQKGGEERSHWQVKSLNILLNKLSLWSNSY